MTTVHHTDTVVYEVALCEHPLVVGEDDDRTDEELIAEVEQRTQTTDDLDWPDWMVCVSDPPDMETVRYVNTASRINVLAPYDTDPFEPIMERVNIKGFDLTTHKPLSHWGATSLDDFEGDIHLDLTAEEMEEVEA